MFWCNLFKCRKCNIEELDKYIDTTEAGCKLNCELCLFAQNIEGTSDISVSNNILDYDMYTKI